MANTTAKKTTAEKILDKAAQLEIVSAKLAKREHLMTLTDSEEIKKELSDMSERYKQDVVYLRKSTVSLLMKNAETMKVAEFMKFAQGLAELVS